jgi:C-terminal processing protease CtpA/Prc
LLFLTLVLLSLAACASEPLTDNEFVDGVMRDLYYWYREVPPADPAAYATPAALLEALRYSNDRWSYVTDKATYQAFMERGEYYGFGFGVVRVDPDQLYVRTVYPGSPAAAGGLRRGTMILAINAVPVAQLLAEGGLEATLGDGTAAGASFELEPGGTVVLDKAVVAVRTVLTNRIIEKGGSRIAYLHFTGFTGSAAAELGEAFAAFRLAGVDELVLDLRYNGGGYIDTARYLAALIGGEAVAGKVFGETRHNDRYRSWDRIERFDNAPPAEALGLSRLVVLVTGETASASELVINSLAPYIDVYLVGASTHGKPFGMYPLVYNQMVFAPVSIKVFNSLGEGDYEAGFSPSVAADDDVTIDFADEADPLLAAALDILEGTVTVAPRAVPPASSLPPLVSGFRREIGSF